MKKIREFIKKTVYAKISIAVIFSFVYLGFSILLIGTDSFNHGFYCTEPDISEKEKSGFSYIDLSKEGYTMTFSPENKNFAGIEIYVTNLSDDSAGTIVLKIADMSGKLIETGQMDVSKLSNDAWHAVYTKKTLKEGVLYSLTISADVSGSPPRLLFYEDSDTLQKSPAIAFGYSMTTFSTSEKIVFMLFVLSAWILLMTVLCIPAEQRRRPYLAALFLAGMALMTWNYVYNNLDNQNSGFSSFQAGSETLVSGVLVAEKKEIYPSTDYGLGRYTDIIGDMSGYSRSFNAVSDDDWEEGYSLTKPMVCLPVSAYTETYVKKGNYIQFTNDAQLLIKDVEKKENYFNITLDSDVLLEKSEYGELSKIRFLDAQGELLPEGVLGSYRSQYGLQGKVFRVLGRFLSLDRLNLLCALGTAFVFMLIVFLITKKYDILLGICFYIVFLLSPWVVNFARNLYWVEFTWFIPMLIGLACSIWIEKRWVRFLCYAAMLASVMIKSLCGYEYITTVMLTSVSFLIADFVCFVTEKDWKKCRRIFWATFLTGFSALIGFLSAVCLHARIKGNGNLIDGIQLIIENDLLRRTLGGNVTEFGDGYADSLNASIWEVFSKYFKFSTQIITGITGNLFPLLCIASLVILSYQLYKKKADVKIVSLYIIFFLATVSWYILGKSHSYIHTHMNYVLWYFGFVQICFYIILKNLIDWVRNERREK